MFLIKQYREKQGLTQKQLAEKIDVTTEYISYIENGQRTPSLALLKKIAKSLSINVKDLIEE